MNKFINKNIFKKIIYILIIIILSFNTVCTKTYAKEDDEMNSVGGVLFKPVLDFFLSMGDVVMEVSTKIVCQNPAFTNLNYVEFEGTKPDAKKSDKEKIAIFPLTPESIFSNKILLLDVNFFNPQKDSSAEKLASPIATWFVATRNIALVGMLCVLAYIALRIITTAAADKKAKYKQLILDWIIGLLLLFFMHYIMSFMVTVVENVSEGINEINKNIDIEYEIDNKFLEVSGSDERQAQIVQENLNRLEKIGAELVSENEDSKTYRIKGNITSLVRSQAENSVNHGKALRAFGYVIIYGVLVLYTIVFLVKYIKRLIMIAFLTVISPMVAFTYAIDKAKDGKAQALGMWFKEYIINLMIQPMHLILYTVLMGTVIELAETNPLYAIVAFGFMAEAEKIVRSIFGFDQARTANSSSFLSGALVSQGFTRLKSNARRKQGKHAKHIEESKNNKIRLANRTVDDEEDQEEFILSGLRPNSQENVNENIEKTNENAQKQISNNEIEQKEAQENEKQKDKIKQEEQQAKDKNIAKMKNEEKETRKSKVRAIRGAILKTGKKYALKGGKKLVKFGLGTAGAATLGMVGIAAGLASDDYSNVFKYGAAAAAGGSLVGKSIGDKVTNIPSSVENIKEKAGKLQEEYIKNLYEDDPEGLNIALSEKYNNEFKNNKQIQQKYKAKFGSSKYKEAIENAIEYRKMGVTDDDIIMKSMKLKNIKGSDEQIQAQKIRIAMVASNVNKEKDIERISKNLQKKGADKEEIESLMNQVRKVKGLL